MSMCRAGRQGILSGKKLSMLGTENGRVQYVQRLEVPIRGVSETENSVVGAMSSTATATGLYTLMYI